MTVRFGELKRLQISLKNMNECFSNQLNINENTNMIKILNNFILCHPYKRQIQVYDIERVTRIIENIWINELYLKDSIEKNKELIFDRFEFIVGQNHFFFMDFVAFYYSIFNSISLIAILFDQNTKNIGHKRRIRQFNNRVLDTKYLKENICKPFSLIIKDNHIYLNNKMNKVDNSFHKQLDKYIDSYDTYTEQIDSNGNYTITECENTLRFCRSIVKAHLNEDEKSPNYSFVNYFLSFRHYFHYNYSMILDNSDYSFDKLIQNIRIECYKLLQYFNHSIELIFYNITKLDLNNIYDDFKGRISSKSKGIEQRLTEDIEERIKMIG